MQPTNCKQYDKDEFAAMAGFKNAESARVTIRSFKKKLTEYFTAKGTYYFLPSFSFLFFPLLLLFISLVFFHPRFGPVGREVQGRSLEGSSPLRHSHGLTKALLSRFILQVPAPPLTSTGKSFM